MTDLVNNPPHYKKHPSGVECITITEHMGFNLGNAVKYIWRCDEKKDAIEDLEKAKWYIEREIAKRNKKLVVGTAINSISDTDKPDINERIKHFKNFKPCAVCKSMPSVSASTEKNSYSAYFIKCKNDVCDTKSIGFTEYSDVVINNALELWNRHTEAVSYYKNKPDVLSKCPCCHRDPTVRSVLENNDYIVECLNMYCEYGKKTIGSSAEKAKETWEILVSGDHKSLTEYDDKAYIRTTQKEHEDIIKKAMAKNIGSPEDVFHDNAKIEKEQGKSIGQNFVVQEEAGKK